MLPNSSIEIIEIIQKTIEFNPENRSYIEDIIQNPYFDEIRDPEMENFPIYPIHLEIDDFKSPIDLSDNFIRELFLKE